MTNEKHINSWKDRLNDLSSLAGENSRPMDKSWEKLDARLNTKKEKRHFRWYWIAAASILVFVTVSILQPDKKETSIHEIARGNKTPVKKEIKKTIIVENNPAILTATLPAQEKTIQPVANKLQEPPSAHIIKDSSFQVQLNPVETDSVNNIAAVPGTIKERPVVFPSLKKKLPMVHLNELEKPIPAVEAVAGNSERPGRRIRFFNRDISPVSNEAGNNIITIKLPPQN